MLLVDETSIRKRHRYVTVLVNGDTGEVLAMVPHRDTQALSGFLAAQGHRWCRGVKVVVSDGSAAYKAAIEARHGHARHVLDRFHVIRWFQAGLIAVRRDVQRRPEGSKPAFDPEVFRSRFLLMRRPDKLDAAEQSRLDALFAAHPRLKAAWDALGELHQLYLADDREGALEALDRFADIYRTGDIPEFSDTVDTFLAWHQQILNWHQTGRPSNGRIDRTNNLHPSPATPSPRLHQLRQLRSPRPPPNMNPAEPSSPNPNKRRRLDLPHDHRQHSRCGLASEVLQVEPEVGHEQLPAVDHGLVLRVVVAEADVVKAHGAGAVVVGVDGPFERQPLDAFTPVKNHSMRRLPGRDPTRDLHLELRSERRDPRSPVRSSKVCGTHHNEIPGPVATARHTVSTSPITPTDRSITRPEVATLPSSFSNPAMRVVQAITNPAFRARIGNTTDRCSTESESILASQQESSTQYTNSTQVLYTSHTVTSLITSCPPATSTPICLSSDSTLESFLRVRVKRPRPCTTAFRASIAPRRRCHSWESLKSTA